LVPDQNILYIIGISNLLQLLNSYQYIEDIIFIHVLIKFTLYPKYVWNGV